MVLSTTFTQFAPETTKFRKITTVVLVTHPALLEGVDRSDCASMTCCGKEFQLGEEELSGVMSAM